MGDDGTSGNPLKVLERLDPKLLEHVEEIRKLALAEGALPRKYKLLIAMALDAAHGASQGVKALAKMAIEAGATEKEVAEALRVAFYVSGAGSVYTAAHGLNGLFKQDL